MRLIDSVYHSTLGLRVIKKQEKVPNVPKYPGKIGHVTDKRICNLYGNRLDGPLPKGTNAAKWIKKKKERTEAVAAALWCGLGVGGFGIVLRGRVQWCKIWNSLFSRQQSLSPARLPPLRSITKVHLEYIDISICTFVPNFLFSIHVMASSVLIKKERNLSHRKCS